MRRLIVIAIPYLWLLALFLIPFVIVVKISLSDVALARPPYFPQWDWSAGWQGIRDFFAELDKAFPVAPTYIKNSALRQKERSGCN